MCSQQRSIEANFDGLVGPTHNYSGLAYGNVASAINKYQVSNPREAALQGLKKMKLLADRGVIQGVLPPQKRPYLPSLHAIGFRGSDHQIIASAMKEAPEIFFATSSAASMWAANSATVSPSCDSDDRRVHLTPANLSNNFHRSIEYPATAHVLKQIFPNTDLFVHHPCLPPGQLFADEGAANHCRLSSSHSSPGVQLFVFGRRVFDASPFLPQKYPARQSDKASQAIARLHRLQKEQVVFAQQHPKAIDAGAFHNDVVAVSNENVFLFHEHTFVDQTAVLEELQQKLIASGCERFYFLEVKETDIPLKDAVESYLFNSQLVTLSDGKMLLLAPLECQENSLVKDYLEQQILKKDNPISEIIYLNLRESMRNGGGPGCLRLRIVLTAEELAATNPHFLLTEALYQQLTSWIKKYYRDRLHPNDLADPQFFDETQNALEQFPLSSQIK